MKSSHRRALRRIARRRRGLAFVTLDLVELDPRTGHTAAAPFLVVGISTGTETWHDGPETDA